ncbi:MAG: hypothetical protein FWF44_11875, partial [Defluviitaleaceae bacterium]|nr:hypothetical protein [Defluviitaleaceae bacterium]
MQNYKELLSERLHAAVEAACARAGTAGLPEKAGFVNFRETDAGFYCDYAVPPINPAIFAEIAKNMYALCGHS